MDNFQVNSELNTLVNCIKNDKHVQKIYLFGSYAYGTPHKESDYDIAVLSDLPKEEVIDNAVDIMMLIGDNFLKPYDLLVFNIEEFFKSAKESLGIEKKILNEGIELYGIQ